jgi:hypothetical protein
MLQRIDDECGELSHELLDAVDRELVDAQGEAMSFLDGSATARIASRRGLAI